MRGIVLGVMVIAACGGDGGGGGGGGGNGGSGGGSGVDTQQCAADAASFHAIVDRRQSCTADSDCTVVLDNCFGPAFCGAYVTIANADAARNVLADGRTACQCGDCSAPAPARCVNGACGSLFALCQMLAGQMAELAAANTSCAQDSDCHFVAELGPGAADTQHSCNTFINSDGQTNIAALEQRWADAKCPGSCGSAPTPHCTNGSCS